MAVLPSTPTFTETELFGKMLRIASLALGLALSRGQDDCAHGDGNALLQSRRGNSSLALLSPEDPPNDYSFEEYMKQFQKSYPDKEELQKRKQAFETSLKEVREHNAGKFSWKLGINEFSDYFPQELKAMRGLRKDRTKTGTEAMKEKDTASKGPVMIPDSFDWREKGEYVTPAKNQGHCGSCWAFAATAVIESHAAIRTGILAELGPQMMVSCAPNPRACGGTGGCEGATAQIGFGFVMNNALTYEETVSYSSFWGSSGECTDTMKLHYQHYPVVSVQNYVSNPTNQLGPLMEALVTAGPQAISVDASGWSPYVNGIADFCPTDRNIDIDHAVVLMGYGEENGVKYWTIRNSWGTLWGEDGYIRLIRHEKEQTHCGYDRTPMDGSACADEHVTEQYVCGTCGILFDTSYPTGAHFVGVGSGDVNR